MGLITTAPEGLCYYSLSFSYHHQHPLRLTKKKKKKLIMGSTKLFLNNTTLSSHTGLDLSFLIQASNSQREEESSTTNDTTGTSEEDLNYLWKLGAGSVAGAAVIKYGSILFPDITRPNIIQALIMISAPVIVAIVLLIKQSRE